MRLDFEGLSLSGKTVIVIEDDPTLRTLLVEILSELGACLRSITQKMP